MSTLVRNLLLAGFIFFVCSCSVSTRPDSSASATQPPNDTAHLANVFSQQNECYGAWSNLVFDWKKNGGGFKKSLLATRHQIATDQMSVFAKIVRDVWSTQSRERSFDGRFGSWPVNSTDTMSVIVNPNDAISKTLNQYLPRGCGAFVWLYPVIWDQVHVVVRGKVQGQRFVEMPDDIAWDSYNTPRWVLYWLFVRDE